MRLNPVDFGAALPIDGYGPGFFRVAGKVHHGPLLLLPSGQADWQGLGHWAALAGAQLDVLFIGTGAALRPLTEAEREGLDGIPFEPMATPAAARTYNVLLSEGRRVGVALLPA